MVTNLSIAEALLEGAQTLRAAGVPEARREAASLLAYVVARDRTHLITHAEDELGPPDVQRFRAYVERRARGEPLQYITGRQEFYGLDFEVTRDVLIPRPETELLVETALDLLGAGAESPLICDVGAGSGCIAIAILSQRQDARAIGLDISTAALRVAARNAVRHTNVRARIKFIASDCFSALGDESVRFRMIVANPPYVAERALAGLQREVRDHEPRVALTPGGDGLRIIRRLLIEAPRFLHSGGHLLMEIGFDQHETVWQLINSDVWTLLDVHKDLQGIPRIVALKKRDEE